MYQSTSRTSEARRQARLGWMETMGLVFATDAYQQRIPALQISGNQLVEQFALAMTKVSWRGMAWKP